MACQQVQLRLGGMKRKLAANSRSLRLDERDRTSLSGRPHQSNRHFVRRVKRLDQYLLVAFSIRWNNRSGFLQAYRSGRRA